MNCRRKFNEIQTSNFLLSDYVLTTIGQNIRKIGIQTYKANIFASLISFRFGRKRTTIFGMVLAFASLVVVAALPEPDHPTSGNYHWTHLS